MTGTDPSRRAFLRRAGLSAAGLAIGGPALLAACTNAVAKQQTVRVVNAPLALDDSTTSLFEFITGVKLAYSEYTDAAAYLSKMTPALQAHRDIGADVLVMPDLQTAQMIEAGYLRPLPSHPPAKLIVPDFRNPAFDPGRRFSLPWWSTMVGLVYDVRRVPSLQSVGALFDPRYMGKVVLSSDAAQTLGMAMFALGLDPATATAAQAAAALQRVQDADASGQIRSFATTEYLDDILTGRALVAIGRSDELRVAKQISPTLRFVVPTEGGLLVSTNMVVPVGARDAAAAKVFIDYMFKPAPSSRLSSFGSHVPAVTGADGALQAIDVKAALDPLVVPTTAEYARLKIWAGTAASDAVASQFATLAAARPAA